MDLTLTFGQLIVKISNGDLIFTSSVHFESEVESGSKVRDWTVVDGRVVAACHHDLEVLGHGRIASDSAVDVSAINYALVGYKVH